LIAPIKSKNYLSKIKTTKSSEELFKSLPKIIFPTEVLAPLSIQAKPKEGPITPQIKVLVVKNVLYEGSML
jgi:hypothetical protein